MNNCYIVIHQGIGDLFNSIGIINYYASIYDTIYVFLLNNTNLQILNEIYFNNNKIIPIIPDFVNYNNSLHPNTCLNCMTPGNKDYCPRNHNIECKYINYDNYKGEIIKIGSFNNANTWENFRLKQFSFAHSFYIYNNLDHNIRFDYFNIFNDKEKEKNIYKKFKETWGNEYILIHEDHERNFFIDKNKIINKNLPIINLDKISNFFVDYLEVIQNAKEIHLIVSSWSVLIYLLSYKIIKNIPIFLNSTFFKNNARDINIYKNPTFDNWVFY